MRIKPSLDHLAIDFDRVSNAFIAWINEDGSGDMEQIAVLFSRDAPDEPEAYARLFQKIMRWVKWSPGEEEPIDPDQSFYTTVLDRCTQYIEQFTQPGEMGIDSNESAGSTSHRGFGLLRFFGELYKLQLVDAQKVHQSIKRFLQHDENLEAANIERFCSVLATFGQFLDDEDQETEVDLYFSRMDELMELHNMGWRTRVIFQVCCLRPHLTK